MRNQSLSRCSWKFYFLTSDENIKRKLEICIPRKRKLFQLKLLSSRNYLITVRALFGEENVREVENKKGGNSKGKSIEIFFSIYNFQELFKILYLEKVSDFGYITSLAKGKKKKKTFVWGFYITCLLHKHIFSDWKSSNWVTSSWSF